MTLRKLVTKCFEFLSPDEIADHCPACQQLQLHRNSQSKKSHLTKRCCAKPQEPKETKIKKTANWKLNCAKLISGGSKSSNASSTSVNVSSSVNAAQSSFGCVCAGYRKVDEPTATTVGSADIQLDTAPLQPNNIEPAAPLLDQLLGLAQRNDDFPNEDCDETARADIRYPRPNPTTDTSVRDRDMLSSPQVTGAAATFGETELSGLPPQIIHSQVK